MRMTKTLRAATVGLLAATTLALGACSGGVGGDNTTNSASTDGELVIGMLAPFSGPSNMYGEYMRTGAQIAIDELNAAGGVLGRQVRLQTEDDACDPTQAAAAAQKLVTAGVVASVGGYCSNATVATLPIFLTAKVPMVIPVANSDNLLAGEQPNVFLLDGIGTRQAAAAVTWVEKNEYANLVVIDDKTDYSENLAKRFKEQAEDKGLTVTALSLTQGESDFSAQVNQVKTVGPDFVYFTGYTQEAGLLVKQLVEAGYTGHILLGDGSVEAKVAEIAGQENAKDVHATFTMTPDMLDDGGVFAEKYAGKTNGDPVGPYAMHSYDSVKVWAEAVEEAGTTEMDAVDAALKAITTEGLTGPISFNADGSRDAGGDFVVVKVSDDGSFKFADDLKD